MPRPTCKDPLLDAAEAIVREEGAAHLTLDAVVERSGVSKGGLLYHFPTKEALIEGMMTRLMERTTERRAMVIEEMKSDPAKELKAEIKTLLEGRETDKPILVGMLAALANSPRMMCKVREIHKRRFEAQEQYENYEKRAFVLLSTLGLFNLELMQISPFTEEHRAKLVSALLRFADEVAAET